MHMHLDLSEVAALHVLFSAAFGRDDRIAHVKASAIINR
jgi:hypothetical protein